MRIQLKNTSKGSFSLPGLHFEAGATQWLSEQEIQTFAKMFGIQIGQLVASGKFKVVTTEPDDLETQFVKQLIVQSPNGALWQIAVSNAGVVSASSVTAVAPHNSLGL